MQKRISSIIVLYFFSMIDEGQNQPQPNTKTTTREKPSVIPVSHKQVPTVHFAKYVLPNFWRIIVQLTLN